MCGIAGILAPEGRPADLQALTHMLSSIQHRGPDDLGVVVEPFGTGWLYLGTVRLGQQDIARGAQPFRSRKSGIVLALNGEIVNHMDLRRQFCRHRIFDTQSDTETVLALWEELGPETVEHLDGMFALAVVDGDALWLARDLAGVKPLYYADAAGTFLFSSEPKSLLAGGVAPRANSEALFEAQVFGFPLRNEFWQGISSLPAGSVMRIARPSALWDIEPQLTERHSLTQAILAPAERPLASALQDSFVHHWEGDVKPVVFLSGGLDSSLLLWSIAAAENQRGSVDPIRTITFGDLPDLPDVVAARRVADRLGCDHEEVILSPDSVIDALAQAVVAAEHPAASPALHIALAKTAARSRAAVCGEGADEVFGGYWVHKDPRAFLRGALYRLTSLAGPHGSFPQRAWEELRYLGKRDPDVLAVRVAALFLGSQLEDMHLTPWDRAGMANGVEVRVPYLSRGVATSAGTTPINGTFGSDKLLLRKAAATMMPADLQELCLGREKQSAPSNARVVADAVELFAQDVLSSEYVDGHPGLKFKTALAGRASWILGCDLLAAGIVLYNGTPPVEFTARSLYRMISRDVLRDAVDQVWRAET